jgi:lipid-binding SYLF domain-containing protein
MKITSLKSYAKFITIVAVLVCVLTATAQGTPDEIKARKQQVVRDATYEALQRLYKAEPKSKSAIAHAAGYAVFTNTGVKILLAGGGSGQGMAVNNKTKKEKFMKMVEVQAGLGMGVKKVNVFFVFDNEKVLNTFINSGWQFGGQANVSAKTKDKGGDLSGAVSVSEGIWMYQMTEKGLSAEITGKGTKYYKDGDLN